MVDNDYIFSLGEFLNEKYGAQARQNFWIRIRSGSRAGRAFMNTLSLFDYDGYSRILGTLGDPSYDDNKLPKAIDILTGKQQPYLKES